ncbi:ArpU family phage packaging/lysis transcriptional regulator [Bacillus thuringiensis]|nr:ArpU family phage packaging/lysis transcriptional regulator [Bacillus thuringiensis]MED3068141.1 ArpU family phage packaging/lysis transcriptional regulator [Bacillus thuringiensis]
MTKQVTFLPKTDRTATKKLEGILENVRLYRQFGMMCEEMKVIPSYEIRYHGPTNDVGKLLEEVAMANIQQSERAEWIKETSVHIDQLLIGLGNGGAGKDQRNIIIKGYLKDEDVSDYMVYNEIGMSIRTYRRVKARVFYKLASALRLEIYETKKRKATSIYCKVDRGRIVLLVVVWHIRY